MLTYEKLLLATDLASDEAADCGGAHSMWVSFASCVQLFTKGPSVCSVIFSPKKKNKKLSLLIIISLMEPLTDHDEEKLVWDSWAVLSQQELGC